MSEFLRRIKMLFQRNQFQSELDEEIRLHLDLREQAKVSAGVSIATAHRETYLRFGNPVVMRERSLRAWGWNWLETFAQDVIYGFRSMGRTPILTSVALFSLALGIGANTAIFSFLDALVLRSLPVKQPSQLLVLGDGKGSGITDDYGTTRLYSYPFFREFQQKNTVFSDVAAAFTVTNNPHGIVDHRDQVEPMSLDIVSGSYFATLGVEPAMGRLLSPADDVSEGSNPVVVVSYAWWQRALAGDQDVLSHTIKLGDTTFNIIGVAPSGFSGIMVGRVPDIWVPMSMMRSVPQHWEGYKDNFYASDVIFGRLKSGVTRQQAEADTNLLRQQIIRSFPDVKLDDYSLGKLSKSHVTLTSMATGLSFMRDGFSDPLKILMGVTGLVLLIACANIANLLLARSTVRAREFAVRQALGAGRMRLIRQLITESLLLAFVGGALGVAFASVANHFLLRMISQDEVVPLDVSLNYRLLSFSIAVTVATAIFFGIVPAFKASRVEVTETLKDGRGASAGAARSFLGKTLVIAQVAVSLVLTVAAVLFLRSLVNLTHVDTGFTRDNVLRLEVHSDVLNLKDDDPRKVAMFREIEQRVSALHGVKGASFAAFFFDQGSWNTRINVPGVAYNDRVNVKHNIIGDDYFNTLQIPVLAGRTFTSQDVASSHRVAIISESMMRDLFPGGVNPVGLHYFQGRNPEPADSVEVIGVVKDVKFGSLQEKTQYIDYVPNAQRPVGYGSLAVRYEGDFNAISTAVQQAIHAVNRGLPVSHITTLDEQVQRSITNQRLVAQLSAFFGLLAVFLSAIGIYGLMSYVVGRRTSEIGIRMALGAGRSGVRWMVMREIVLLVAMGVGVGTALSLAAGRLVAKLLYGVQPTEPRNLALAIAVLLTVALLAGYLPARRASQISPMEAFRCE